MIKAKGVKIAKEVMACDVSPVAMFFTEDAKSSDHPEGQIYVYVHDVCSPLDHDTVQF